MFDSPEERLAALYFLRRVQERDLARTDRWIAAEEQRAIEQQPPPALRWVIQRLPSRTRELHVLGCWVASGSVQFVDNAEAAEALAGGAAPCDVCEPDKELDVPG